MGSEVAAYYLSLSRSLVNVSSYDTTFENKEGHYLMDVKGETRDGEELHLRFIVRKEGEHFKIEDILRM